MVINFKTRNAARTFNAARKAKGLPSSVGDRETFIKPVNHHCKTTSRYYVRLTA